jgi:predicted permease
LLIFVSASIIKGYRGIELIALAAMFTAPTAVSSYTMAEIMDANGQLAAQSIVFTSIFSFATIFITIYLIKLLNFI